MHNITKIGIELTRSKMTGDGSAGKERRKIEEQARAKSFLGDCMLYGTKVTKAAMDTLESLNNKGM